MKTVIMVKNMECEHCAKKIEQALKDANIEFEIRLDSKTVVVEGGNDVVRYAKQIIDDIGFDVI